VLVEELTWGTAWARSPAALCTRGILLQAAAAETLFWGTLIGAAGVE